MDVHRGLVDLECSAKQRRRDPRLAQGLVERAQRDVQVTLHRLRRHAAPCRRDLLKRHLLHNPLAKHLALPLADQRGSPRPSACMRSLSPWGEISSAAAVATTSPPCFSSVDVTSSAVSSRARLRRLFDATRA